MENLIAEIVVGLPVEGPFDYLIPEGWLGRLMIGQRVAVIFANVKRLGIVVGLKPTSIIKNVRPILSVLDVQPWFDASFVELAKTVKDRYGCALGEALVMMLPKALRLIRPLDLQWNKSANNLLKGERLWICSQNLNDHWIVIQNKIKDALSYGCGVIVLVADSAQIPYVQSQLKSVLPDNTIIHENERTSKQELEGWSALRSGQVRVIIGLRSAVFAPVCSLGLIVMYDEDNPSYQEEQSPFYHTREIVMMRSRIEKCSVCVVSFSATIEMVYLAQQESFVRMDFSEKKAIRRQMIDMTNYASKGFLIISFPLRNSLERALALGQKAIVVINRRGHSTLTRCLFCGHMMRCPRCTTNLSFSVVKKKLECRRCSTAVELPKKCPHCSKEYLKSIGVGVERVVQEIRRIFPFAKVQGFDREVEVFPSQFDILVTTQAVLRMFGRMIVHTVGILDVDAEFNRTDYRSSQKVFSFLMHLSLMAKDSIEIQTMNIDNEVLRFFSAEKIQEFYQGELLLRNELNLPPYQHWVSVVLRGREENVVSIQSQALYNLLAGQKFMDIEVLSVRPDNVAKLRDQYRFVIFVRGKEAWRTLNFVKETIGKLKKKKGVIITLQVDP